MNYQHHCFYRVTWDNERSRPQGRCQVVKIITTPEDKETSKLCVWQTCQTLCHQLRPDVLPNRSLYTKLLLYCTVGCSQTNYWSISENESYYVVLMFVPILQGQGLKAWLKNIFTKVLHFLPLRLKVISGSFIQAYSQTLAKLRWFMCSCVATPGLHCTWQTTDSSNWTQFGSLEAGQSHAQSSCDIKSVGLNLRLTLSCFNRAPGLNLTNLTTYYSNIWTSRLT